MLPTIYICMLTMSLTIYLPMLNTKTEHCNGIYTCFGVQGNTDRNQHMNTYGLFSKEFTHAQQRMQLLPTHGWF
jgi:hypothetical protein